MASLNSCQFTGNLGRDPELREAAGKDVCSFSLAVEQFGRDAETLWLDVSVWGASAVNVERYCSKGSQVAVSGRVGLRTYTKKDGTMGASVTLDARDVVFIGGKQDDNAREAAEQAAPSDVEPAAEDLF